MTYKLPDFDTLMALARHNPEALEAIRKEATESVIQSACKKNQRRLRGLQFQVDMEIRRSHSPMESCIQISKMMHDKLWDLRASLSSSRELSMDPENHHQKQQPARILPFKV